MMTGKVKVAAVVLLLLTALLGGCASPAATTPASPTAPATGASQPAETAANGASAAENAVPGTNTMRLTVYQATADGMYLVPDAHVVPKNDHPARTALELLLAGTNKPNTVSVVPKGTKVRNLWLQDHIAYVDFNDKIVKNNTGGSAAEMLLVGAIVNTLTEFQEVHKVQILVEGKNIDTISGHMDISEPLSRSEKIIKK
ncbi:MAG: GerMN domain-containing protein [Veillonellales bacterium]